MIANRTQRVLVQLGAWLFFLGLPIIFLASQRNAGDIFSALGSWEFVVFMDVFVIGYYINYHVLIPKLALNRRIPLYVLSVIAFFVLLYFLRPYDRLVELINEPVGAPPPPGINPPGGRIPPQFDIVSIFLGIVVVAAALVAALQDKWRNTAMQLTKMQNEKLNAELAFLKARVNPHFLFNTLNNIYVLAEQKSDSAGESIMRLSAIMRYVTDEVAAERVPLQSEIKCLEDLAALQRLRLNEQTTIEYSCSGPVSLHRIAPLVLMPFVENAFKFGVSNHEPSVIQLKIDCDEQCIHFYCRNKIVNTPKDVSRTGTGLDDVKMRLNYLYGSRHQLSITENDGYFEVKLALC